MALFTSPYLTQPRSHSHHLLQSKHMQGSWTGKHGLCWQLAGPKAPNPRLGCPCVHLVSREQPDLSFTVIGLVFWVCPPSSCQKTLYRNGLLHRPQFRCRLRPKQRKFPVRSLITLNTRLLLAALSSSCNHFCSNWSSEVTL